MYARCSLLTAFWSGQIILTSLQAGNYYYVSRHCLKRNAQVILFFVKNRIDLLLVGPEAYYGVVMLSYIFTLGLRIRDETMFTRMYSVECCRILGKVANHTIGLLEAHRCYHQYSSQTLHQSICELVSRIHHVGYVGQ